MVGFQRRGRRGLRLRQLDPRRGQLGGYPSAFDFPGFVPAYIRPLFCEGKGPFRWVALSGDPEDIHRDRPRDPRAVPRATRRCALDHARPRRRWPSRGCPRASAGSATGSVTVPGVAFNELVASGEVAAPIVIGRDHLDCGSVASPYRETESMLDGSDAIADWPLLNALVNTASGASWVSIHNGGGVGIGRSLHAGQVTVADGTPLAAREDRAGCSPTTPARRHAPRRRRLRATPSTSPRSAACACPCSEGYGELARGHRHRRARPRTTRRSGDGPAGATPRRGHRARRRRRRVGRGERRRTRRPPTQCIDAQRRPRSSRGSWTATRTWSSPATASDGVRGAHGGRAVRRPAASCGPSRRRARPTTATLRARRAARCPRDAVVGARRPSRSSPATS